MKLMKVFDCQDMPEDLQKSFFDYCLDIGVGNDSYIDWNVNEEFPAPINKWLVRNDAVFGETVLIKHWW